MSSPRFSPSALAFIAIAIAATLAACASHPQGGSAAPVDPSGPQPGTPAPSGGAPAVPAAPDTPNPYAGVPETEWPPNYQTLRIKVSGMTCPIKCVREVKEMLSAVRGVLHVRIEYDDREAVVDVAPGTDPQTVLHGLTSGYSGRLM